MLISNKKSFTEERGTKRKPIPTKFIIDGFLRQSCSKVFKRWKEKQTKNNKTVNPKKQSRYASWTVSQWNNLSWKVPIQVKDKNKGT